MLVVNNDSVKYSVGNLVNQPGSSTAAPAIQVERVVVFYDLVKRGIDLLVAPFLLVAVSPIMLLAAIAIRISSPGPVIFKQRRLSYGNRVFTMYKFRTMRTDAESNTGPVWAQDHDPRTFAIGRLLRATRIDELPQLVNVVLGDMSLIGPRPERPEIAAQLAKELPAFNRRLEVKAGITGLAQIASGYASCRRSYRRKLALDIKYVDNRSLWLDLQIAFKTIWVILSRSGAK